jgi:hypothetical protein
MDYWAPFLTPTVLAPGGIIGLFFVLFYTGRIVPYSRVKELRADHAVALANREAELAHAKKTIEMLTQSVQLYAQAAEAQTQTAEIVKTVMRSLQEQAREIRDEKHV